MEPVLQFLHLVEQELGALSARLEVSRHAPEDDNTIWCPLKGDWRLVAVFDAPPPDRSKALEHLGALATSFTTTLERATDDLPAVGKVRGQATKLALNDALELLSDQTNAAAVLVLDAHSPILWGSFPASPWLEDVDDAARLGATPNLAADLTAEQKIVVRAIALARSTEHDPLEHTEPDFGVFARRFSGIYRLVLAFGGTYSPLAARAKVTKALPIIERLVEELPPIEPPPKGGRVVDFASRRKV